MILVPITVLPMGDKVHLAHQPQLSHVRFFSQGKHFFVETHVDFMVGEFLVFLFETSRCEIVVGSW